MKKYIYTHLITLLSLMLALPYSAAAQAAAPIGLEYSYDDGSTRLALWGTGKKETYDVAMRLDAGELLQGATVSGLYLYLPESPNITNVHIWMSHSLTLDEKKQNVADICSQKVDSTLAFNQAYLAFDKPYTLTAEPIYVGYSFTVPATDEASLNPLLLSYATAEGGFYLHTSKKYLKWREMNSVGNLALVALLTGAPANKAAITAANVYTAIDSTTYAPITLTNLGSNGVRTFEVKATVGGESVTQQFRPAAADTIAARYGASHSYELKLPALKADGAYPLELQLTQINGVDVSEEGCKGEATVDVRRFVPTHRTVMEEYTGTWCSNCPRGYAAMKALKRMYPDHFIGLAYHGASGYNKEPMRVMPVASFPMTVTGFPMASLDRLAVIDPYYGSTTTNGFGMADEWLTQTLTYALADVEVKAALTPEGLEVNAEATVTSPRVLPDDRYKVEFVLVANGLKGEGSDWNQENGYTNATMSQFEIPEMSLFVGKGSAVSGLSYDDVVVATTRLTDDDVHLVGPIEAYEPVLAKASFELSQVMNLDGESVIQDPTKLDVAALLIDTETGQVVNANLCTVDATEYVASVPGVRVDGKREGRGVMYDLTGRKLNVAPERGVYIYGGRLIRK